ncbi:MAG: hypothetical protein Greene041614_219 [Parcubacteria group bacterium Greene0416_14]|nr:MAG: hypothetical protein Greene041614_219 [Parcubacteria group bacterium Greene0416_14]TSD01126.1 MAG: hypothetical protein Greene101415_429 [Parcubacteria group bacterium Greene1014_15]TSD08202.1 MAG: hypothetical protein Greene07144_272 [Parcubacteria group bacterium Greene0714_4]
MLGSALTILSGTLAFTVILLESTLVKVGERATWQGYLFRGVLFPLLLFASTATMLRAIISEGPSRDHVFGLLFGTVFVAVIWPIMYTYQCRQYRRQSPTRSALLE